MQTWLITGGAGFIGSNFARLLSRSNNVRIVIFDALTYAGNLSNLNDILGAESVTFIHADIRDVDAVREAFERYDPTYVLHFAAESHVDRSILGPRAFIDTNVTGTLNLLTAARERWREHSSSRRFVHVSTDEVYGTLQDADSRFNEDTAYAPNSPYAASKAASDHLVRAWHHTYGFPAIISNCSNNYGPWQFPEKLIPLMILNAAAQRELPVYGDGLQVRDWLHVEDHCEALRDITIGGTPGRSYCIGGDSERNNLQIVQSICDLVDKRLGRNDGTSRKLIRHVEDRLGHDRRYAIDAGRIRRELAWRPQRNLEATLPEVVDWYLSNDKWVESTRSGEHLRFYEQQYASRLLTES